MRGKSKPLDGHMPGYLYIPRAQSKGSDPEASSPGGGGEGHPLFQGR